jgi:5-methyltetrahydrofolate--homocysteine methyltransferase
MLIIGERINTSRKGLDEKVAARDEAFFRQLARAQFDAGANYLDVNCGTRINSEPDDIAWLARLVQDETGAPLSIDTPNPAAAEAALTVHTGDKKPIINSISGEKDRYQRMIGLVRDYQCGVIALALDDEGMPANGPERFAKAQKLMDRLLADGVPVENVYLDPLVQPIGSSIDPDLSYGREVLWTLRTFKKTWPDVHCSAGVSNVSHGLPKRKILNQAFMVMCLEAGLDTAIIDPNDGYLMQLILAAEALIGKDPMCANYIAAERSGKIEYWVPPEPKKE